MQLPYQPFYRKSQRCVFHMQQRFVHSPIFPNRSPSSLPTWLRRRKVEVSHGRRWIHWRWCEACWPGGSWTIPRETSRCRFQVESQHRVRGSFPESRPDLEMRPVTYRHGVSDPEVASWVRCGAHTRQARSWDKLLKFKFGPPNCSLNSERVSKFVSTLSNPVVPLSSLTHKWHFSSVLKQAIVVHSYILLLTCHKLDIYQNDSRQWEIKKIM